MSSLHSTTSILAVIEAWNQRQQQKHLTLSLVHWVEYYIPERLVYLRPLTTAECQQIRNFPGDVNKQWYAAFLARTGELFMVGYAIAALQPRLAAAGYTWCQVH